MREVPSHTALDTCEWVNVSELLRAASVESFEVLDAEREGCETLVVSTTQTDSTALSSEDMSLLDACDFEFPDDLATANEAVQQLSFLYSAKRARQRDTPSRLSSASPKPSLCETAYDDDNDDTDSFHDVTCALPTAIFRKRILAVAPCCS